MTDLYKTLDLNRNASDQEIQSAYRKLVLQYHPDRNQGDPEAAAKFKEVQAAYEVLSDPQKKVEYDTYGTVGNHSARRGKPFTSVFDDMFERVFRQKNIVQGEHICILASVTLDQLLGGVELDLSYQRKNLCSHCGGLGGVQAACSHCGGSGAKVIYGAAMTVRASCHACGGAGKVVAGTCEHCQGGTASYSDHSFKFKLPAGAEDGMTFIQEGMGHPPVGEGVNGDLMVRISVQPHSVFERLSKGDLLTKIYLSYPQLVLGSEINVPTLKGSVSLKIPPGTEPSTKFRLKQIGLPVFNNNGPIYRHGDLYVEVRLTMPKQVEGKHLELVQQLAEITKEQ